MIRNFTIVLVHRLHQMISYLARSLIFAITLTANIVGRTLGRLASNVVGIEKPPTGQPSLEARLRRISSTLVTSANDAQALVTEMQTLIDAHSAALHEAETRIADLNIQETATRSRLTELRATTPEAAAIFQDLMRQGLQGNERRANRRDLLLFVFGIAAGLITDFLVGLI